LFTCSQIHTFKLGLDTSSLRLAPEEILGKLMEKAVCVKRGYMLDDLGQAPKSGRTAIHPVTFVDTA
jgi:hypothetical protein